MSVSEAVVSNPLPKIPNHLTNRPDVVAETQSKPAQPHRQNPTQRRTSRVIAYRHSTRVIACSSTAKTNPASHQPSQPSHQPPVAFPKMSVCMPSCRLYALMHFFLFIDAHKMHMRAHRRTSWGFIDAHKMHEGIQHFVCVYVYRYIMCV